MAHNLSNAECTVYVWYLSYRNLIPGNANAAIGHSSIKISDGLGGCEYLSWWPAKFGMPGHSGFTTDLEYRLRAVADPAVNHKMSDRDAEHEGRKPDYKCRIRRGLDFGAMCDFARDVKRGLRPLLPGGTLNIGGAENTAFRPFKQNCSHAVAYCLAAGNPPVAPRLTGRITNIWTPNDVYSYCIELSQALNNQAPGSALQKSAGAAWQ